MYPMADVSILGARFEPTTTTYQIQIILADKMKNKNNESNPIHNNQQIEFFGTDDMVDIHANMLAVINDLVSFTQYGVVGMEINSIIQNEPFADRFNNGLAGWVSTFDFTVHNDRSRCLFNLLPPDQPVTTTTTTTSGPTTTTTSTTAAPTTTTTAAPTTTTTTTTHGPTTTTTGAPTTTTTGAPTTTTTTSGSIIYDLVFFGNDAGAGLIFSSSYNLHGTNLGFGGSNFTLNQYNPASNCDSASLLASGGRSNNPYGITVDGSGMGRISLTFTTGSQDQSYKQTLTQIQLQGNGIGYPYVTGSGQIIPNSYGDLFRITLPECVVYTP
jgi:hypothetical protein